MSSEIAQANEQSSYSNTLANDLPPNTHLEPPGSDTYGMARYRLELIFIVPMATYANACPRFRLLYDISYAQLEL